MTVRSADYEFGPFVLRSVERLLLRDGDPVPLPPKVFDTLLSFVENSGRLLTKADLMDMIWPDSTVEEGNLTQNIFILRRVLRENPHDHRYIVTIPLQGYKFVAQVREVERSYSPAPERAGAGDAPRVSGADVRSLAILPFKSLSDRSDSEYLGAGIANALITKLSRLRRIVVRPTTATLKYKDRFEHDPLDAGREQQVDVVLDGTVQRAGGRIRVCVQLVSVHRGGTLWAERFDADFSDIFAVQDSISEHVARVLAVELSREEKNHLTRNYTENIEAYQLYIEGRYFWDKRTERGLLKGLEYAERMIELDPSYAPAHVVMADSYALLGEYLYLPPDDAFPKARAAASRALEIDGDLAEAHASLAEVLYYYEWDWAGAEAEYRLAIEMNPNYAAVKLWYAWFLMAQGRSGEAVVHLSHAQRIDPGSLTLNTILGLPYYYERRYDRAITQYGRTLEMEPDFQQAHYYLGEALTMKGMYAEALAAYRKVSPAEYEQQVLALVGYAHAVSGDREAALRTLENLERLAQQRYVSSYVKAIIYAGLEEEERALALLERAYEERATWMVFLSADPLLDRLRPHHRFQHLLERMGL
jgi:TolB-like protein/Tfp pilus assembly protein PilF